MVHRPRLVQQLADGLRSSLTLISAPPGFGKTTLLVEWTANEPRPITWIALDSGDSDPGRFVANLAYAFAPLLNTADLPASLPPQTTLEALLGKLTAETVLVLDDFHIIQSAPVHDLLAFLIEHLPTHLRLVIATRADPPIPLARLRGRGELKELRADDLRFTNEEAAAYLREGMGLTISPELVAILETKTEGWVSGLQLAALSMQGRADPAGFIQAFSGSHRYILDYLVEEVLNRQPASIQRFLLQTSILEKLCAPLCDAVTEAKANSQATLEYLERTNIFTIPLDNERRWYRYHHLFADLLRIRLGQNHPEMVANLHRCAAPAQREFVTHVLACFPQTRFNPDQPALIDPLPPRELEVLRCLAQGDSNQSIADKLFITLSAVKKHTGNLYRKLEAESRTQAIARARELGLL